MPWEQFTSWFIIAVLGASIVKLFDLATNRYMQRKSRTESKVNFLLNYIKEFGELTELYRFLAKVSANAVLDDEGHPTRDEQGKLVIENSIFQPETRFDEAIRDLKGSDINSAIAQKIVTIRLLSAEALDSAHDLDETNKLKTMFTDLYAKTIWTINVILDNKDKRNPRDNFAIMTDALKEADEVRLNIRKEIQAYLK